MSTPMPASGTTPVPPGAFADTGGSAGSTSASGGTAPLSTVFIEIIGVIILALIAGIGPRIGKVTAIFMAGLMVLWAVTHASTLAKLLPGNNQSGG
jgi:hypothetical protein